MADFNVHISQARHNENLALFLLDKPFFDWSITASFYSAIHFFEARLYFDASDASNKHSESSMPVDPKGDFKYSAHSWRAKQIKDNYPQEAWKAFRSLREASETARYLSHHIDLKTKTTYFEKAPSFNIFNVSNASFAIEIDLLNFKKMVKVELVEFLQSLDLALSNPIKGAFVADKVVRNFSDKGEFLNQTKDSLRKYMSKEEIDFLEQCLSKKGFFLKK